MGVCYLWSAMVKGLFKIGDNVGAFHLLSKTKGGICKPDAVIYSTIIDCLCQDKLLPRHSKSLLDEEPGNFTGCCLLQFPY